MLKSFASGDTSQVDQAVLSIQSELGSPPAWSAGADGWGPWAKRVRQLERVWVPALMRAGRNQAAADVALAGMAAMPGPSFLNPLGRMRVEALLAAGQPERALAAARVYFNVCSMDQTAVAIDLVARSLTAARPDDPDAARRFRLEQTDGATTRPFFDQPLRRPLGEPGVTDPKGILAGIAPDAEAEAIYQRATSLHAPSGGEAYSVARYATTLLMAGQPEAARDAFERAADLCVAAQRGAYARPELMAEAMDGIARTIKARDGTVGRANAYVMQLQQAAGITP